MIVINSKAYSEYTNEYINLWWKFPYPGRHIFCKLLAIECDDKEKYESLNI